MTAYDWADIEQEAKEAGVTAFVEKPIFMSELRKVLTKPMDIQMPKMDGYMTTREIRTLRNNRKANIPIVAMTANAFEEDKKKAFKAGMNAHIAKPIDINTILAVLDQVFGV